MDNDQLAKVICSIGIMKHKYIGSFCAYLIPEILPPDSFICNTESSKRPGSHWVMVAKKDENAYFRDSLGNDPFFKSQHCFETFQCSQDSESCRK